LIHIIYIVEHILVLTEPSSGRRKFQGKRSIQKLGCSH